MVLTSKVGGIVDQEASGLLPLTLQKSFFMPFKAEPPKRGRGPESQVFIPRLAQDRAGGRGAVTMSVVTHAARF